MKESIDKTTRDLIRLGDLDGADRIVKAEFERNDDLGPSAEVWGLRLCRADLLRLSGRVEEALEYLLLKESAFPPEGDDLSSIIGLKKTRGYCLGQLGKYAPSHGLMEEAEFLARKAGMLEMLCDVQSCQGMIFYLQKDHEPSSRIYRFILDASDQMDGWYFKNNARWGIGKNLMAQGFYNEAIQWFEESLTIAESAGSRALMALAWGELAVCHLKLGDDGKSLSLLKNALQIHFETGRVQNYLVSLANIGNIYLYRCDYLRAIDYYRRALELAYEIKDPVSIRKWSHNIRLSYARLRESVERMRTTTDSM
ncbi:MAG: tetratricopeptide repeat protein [Terracidiphilus sp.]